MRGQRAKSLMKLARWERTGEANVVERDVVKTRSGAVIHGIRSIRALYLKLKDRFKDVVRQSTDPKPEPMRKRRPTPEVKQKPDRIMWIEKPLDFILGHYPPTRNLDGTYEPHPKYLQARRLADRGNGAAVQAMARALLPA